MLNFSSKNQEDWAMVLVLLTENEMLEIEPTSKNLIGLQTIYIRATDQEGASIIQRLDLEIINVNDPPNVIRPEALKVGTNQWKESIQIDEQEDWIFDTGILFSDSDPNDRISIQTNRYASLDKF